MVVCSYVCMCVFGLWSVHVCVCARTLVCVCVCVCGARGGGGGLDFGNQQRTLTQSIYGHAHAANAICKHCRQYFVKIHAPKDIFLLVFTDVILMGDKMNNVCAYVCAYVCA